MQCLDNTTSGKFNARHNCTIKVNVLNIGTSRQIHCLRQSNTIACIHSLQQRIIAKIQFFEVTIGIAFRCITNFNGNQLDSFGKICQAYLQTRQISNTCQQRSIIDINFSIGHIIQRTFQNTLISFGAAFLNQI